MWARPIGCTPALRRPSAAAGTVLFGSAAALDLAGVVGITLASWALHIAGMLAVGIKS